MLYACDLPWWQVHHEQSARLFHGERWTQCETSAPKYGLHRIPSIKADELSLAPGVIAQGGNSGHQAIGLAHQFGVARVLLLGYDMQRTGGKAHWHGNHPAPLGNAGKLAAWPAAMNKLAASAAGIGLEIINCSRETTLTCFPRRALQECLA